MCCKNNTHRFINYTQKEPVDKYSLWLSENARYNSDGQIEYDNNGQPACDLILKLFKNGRWEPIIGYSTSSTNKINIVKDSYYSYTGQTGYTINHIPLFRNPSDSPDELFDAGTVGEVISNIQYVTATDWNNIYDSTLRNAIEARKFSMWHADSSRIGGIKSSELSLEDRISGQSYYIRCGYKPSDDSYNLYTDADSISDSLYQYIKDYPNKSIYNVLTIRTCEDIDNPMVIKGGGEDGEYLSYDGTWSRPQGTIYSNGLGIDISRDNTISQIIADPEVIIPNFSSLKIKIQRSLRDLEWLTISANYRGDEYTFVCDCKGYNVFDLQRLSLERSVTYTIDSIPNSNNPIYIILRNVIQIDITHDLSTIGYPDTIVSTKDYLVTIQFGIIKFEELDDSRQQS